MGNPDEGVVVVGGLVVVDGGLVVVDGGLEGGGAWIVVTVDGFVVEGCEVV
jgi:hypothetical protein